MAKRKSIGKSIAEVAPVIAGRGFVSANAMLIDPVMFAYMPHVGGSVSPTALLNTQAGLAARVHRVK